MTSSRPGGDKPRVGTTSSIHILHVDDDPSFGELVAAFLERHQPRFDVTPVHTPSEAIENVEEQVFDCVISDYDMPGKDRLVLLEEVKDLRPSLPFVLYTGKGSEEIASEAITAGADEYLQKQSDTDHYSVLANRVLNLVKKRRRERELDQILNRMTDAFFALDTEWRFTYINEYAQSLLEKSEPQLLGQKIWTEFPEAVGSTFYDQYHQAMETQETVSFTERYPPLDLEFEVRAYPSPSGLSVYFQDTSNGQ